MSPTAPFANVYLDHAAGTPLDPTVYATMLPYFGEEYRNASSMHRGGRLARTAIEQARNEVAVDIGAKPEEIIFCGSGTEANNLALVGIARAYKARGDHIVISATEHKSIIEPARALEKEGFRVTFLPVDQYGTVTPEQVSAACDEKTILVSLIYANNELGSINPIQEIAGAIRALRRTTGVPLLHTDACQAMNYLDTDVDRLGIDAMTWNGEKIYGPSGSAALYLRRGVKLSPLIRGGDQEQLRRAGTESTPLIVGFSEATRKAIKQRDTESKRLQTLRTWFVTRLAGIEGISINGHPDMCVPNIVHVTIPGIEGEATLLALDEQGIAVSTGSACSAFDLRPSHVLSAIGQQSDLIHGSIRFSFGRQTTKEQLEYTVEKFAEIVRYLRSISAVTTHAYAVQQR